MKSKWTGTVIEQYDHWCPYLGNAVGIRNYRYYVLFMTLCMLACLINVAVMVYILYSMSEQATSVHEFWRDPVVYVAIVFALFCLGMAISLSCLVAHHWQMVCTGMTSLEASKDVFKGMQSPYDLGWKRNLCAMFCSPHLPSRVVGDVDVSPANSDTPSGEHLLIHDTFDAVFSPPPSPMFPAAVPRAASYSNSPIMVACLSEEDEGENLEDEEERL